MGDATGEKFLNSWTDPFTRNVPKVVDLMTGAVRDIVTPEV
jgi:hypothetical protein